MLKKILFKIKFTLKLFFMGLKGGDDVIFGTRGPSNNDGNIIEKQLGGGVFNDLLEQKVTQEVEELRDKYYRVYKDSDKFDTSTITMSINEFGDITGFNTGRLSKKSELFYDKHVKVFNPEGLTIVTIQDNRIYEPKNEFKQSQTALYDYDTTLEIERDGFKPRFDIEKFVKKMVVRLKNEDRAFVDLYLPSEASQFGKIDAILISNLMDAYSTKNLRRDIFDFSKIKWISYKAWGVDDICLFVFDDVKPVDINKFDGNFVFTVDCKIQNNGDYIPEKYLTKTLDEKYKLKSPKTDTISLNN